MSCSQNYKEYNFPRIRTNESFKGVTFRVKVNGEPAVLDDWGAKIEFRQGSPSGSASKTLSKGSGITLSGDAAQVEPMQSHGLTAGEWYYDLVLTDTEGLHHVYFGGTWPIEQGVTTP